jgi:hypothetical protein
LFDVVWDDETVDVSKVDLSVEKANGLCSKSRVRRKRVFLSEKGVQRKSWGNEGSIKKES